MQFRAQKGVELCSDLWGLLEEVRTSFRIEELEKKFEEGRQHAREMDRVINGLVDAVEQGLSSALMVRLG